MIDEKAINYFKTYLVSGYAREPKMAFPRPLTHLILNYAHRMHYADCMKIADELDYLLNKLPAPFGTVLDYITLSDLWINEPSLNKGRAWLKNPIKPPLTEVDAFYKEILNPMIQFLETCQLADKDGWTALIWAVKKGLTETVKAMLAVPGINVNAATHGGITLLMYAAGDSHIEIVKALLAAPGIEVNTADKFGNTALMMAAAHSHTTEPVEALLAFPGIEAKLVNKYGNTALIFAEAHHHEEAAKLIRDHLAAESRPIKRQKIG